MVPSKGMMQTEMVLAAMEIDAPLYSSMKAFPNTRKRINVEMEEPQRFDDSMVATPPNLPRLPAKLRLSVSRKERSMNGVNVQEDEIRREKLLYDADVRENGMEDFELSERRRALFEPLGPAFRGPRDGSPESILPPPDFDTASYPRGWVVGKKRKLVNVDVVESMRRIAVQEMNRKDREINGLNEQLEEDSRTMGHLQMQLQQERTKRMQAERDKNMLQSQINMLMTMLNETEEGAEM